MHALARSAAEITVATHPRRATTVSALLSTSAATTTRASAGTTNNVATRSKPSWPVSRVAHVDPSIAREVRRASGGGTPSITIAGNTNIVATDQAVSLVYATSGAKRPRNDDRPRIPIPTVAA